MSGQWILIDNNRSYISLKIRNAIGNGFEEIKFKYDPGADISVISLTDLLHLGYNKGDIFSMMRPFGSGSSATEGNAEQFVIDLSITNFLRQVMPKDFKFPFICMRKDNVPIPDPKFDRCKTCILTGEKFRGFQRSLVGNDILSCFEIKTDRVNRRYEFTKVSDLTDRNTNYGYHEVFDFEQKTTGQEPNEIGIMSKF